MSSAQLLLRVTEKFPKLLFNPSLSLRDDQAMHIQPAITSYMLLKRVQFYVSKIISITTFVCYFPTLNPTPASHLAK